VLFRSPALVLSKFSRIEMGEGLIVPVLVAWGAMGFIVVVVLYVSRVMQFSRSITGTLLLVAVLGNTSFLGLGMVEGLLGDEHLSAALAYDQLGTFLALATWGSFVASHYGQGQPGLMPIVQRLFRFVPFLALLATIPLRWVEVPESVYSVLDGVGRTVGPVAMGSLGMRFVVRTSRRVLGPALFGLTLKMVAVPLLVLLVAFAMGHPSDIAWSTATLESAMPPMVTAGIVAIGAGLDEELSSFMVGVGTLVSFATVPLISLML
jgi:predicted permease